jgi:signal transduction histidine kinase
MPWSSQAPTVGPPDTAEAADTRSGRRRKAVEQRRRSFLRMVSHELRTPLNTVIGFSEIIASGALRPPGHPRV